MYTKHDEKKMLNTLLTAALVGRDFRMGQVRGGGRGDVRKLESL